MKNPETFLKEWMQTINACDVDALLALYDESAVLTPTFSNRMLRTHEGIRDYFQKLACREELSIALHEKTLITQPIANDVYAMHGIYCWRFAIDGEILSFEARFSYIVDLGRPSPILHHHSSQIPRVI